MAKEMKKITQGRVADRGKKWFPQVTDKRKRTVLCSYSNIMCCHATSGVHQIGKSIKVHLYWAMKNCGDSPSKLQELILNIPCHYQVHVLMSFILHSVINILYMYIYILCTGTHMHARM